MEADNVKKGGICFLCVIYTYFRVPEPRGRSFAELDILFEKKVPARKFQTTEVDVFTESVEGGVMAGYKETLEREKVAAVPGGGGVSGAATGAGGEEGEKRAGVLGAVEIQ